MSRAKIIFATIFFSAVGFATFLYFAKTSIININKFSEFNKEEIQTIKQTGEELFKIRNVFKNTISRNETDEQNNEESGEESEQTNSSSSVKTAIPTDSDALQISTSTIKLLKEKIEKQAN